MSTNNLPNPSEVKLQAKAFSVAIRGVVANARSEEDIRIGTERELALLADKAGIELKGSHEFTVASGRIDSVYDQLFIEYKNPKSRNSRIGGTSSSSGSKALVRQIKSRFADMESLLGHRPNTLLGIGFDGRHFLFVRYYHNEWHISQPEELNEQTAEQFIWALYNLGLSGKPFRPDQLAKDFGSAAGTTKNLIQVLYRSLTRSKSAKTQVLFKQWKILFGEVCGYDVSSTSKKITKLAEAYEVNPRTLRSAELIFCVHTYFAFFMKILAAVVVSHFHKLPSPTRKISTAKNSKIILKSVRELEEGGVFRHLNISNFLEGDLFSWYVNEWSKDLADSISALGKSLGKYNPSTLSEEPNESRDLLKKLYHEVLPRDLRHDLGEYYTPDWLAEHLLNELGYSGNSEERVLDPAVGSGTFLVSAINRIRSSYYRNRENISFQEDTLCENILTNVVGFDLNPLAVIAARTNYLIAIRDLISHVDHVEIPVYLCDSVCTPSDYADLFSGGLEAVKQIPSAAGTFLIPSPIASDHKLITRYCEVLESCVDHRYTPHEFVSACVSEGIEIDMDDEPNHEALYKMIVELSESGRNGIWARIIKNAFAPLFVKEFDLVIGNPPWIFWNNLPDDYRESVRTLMTDTYDIMRSGQSTMRQLGQAGKDLSALFFYVCADKYLKVQGKLGFVITQTIFQSTAGNEFRRFRLPDNSGIKVERVEDWVKVQPFRPKAGNKTALVITKKGQNTKYPIPYFIYKPFAAFDRESAPLSTVLDSCSLTKTKARPHNPSDRSSFWQVGNSKVRSKGVGLLSDRFRARIGVETKLESVFRVRMQATVGSKGLRIQNETKRARILVPEVTATVDKSLVLPYVSGSSITRWKFEIEGHYLCPHTETTADKPIPEDELKTQFRNSYRYFMRFKDELANRSLHKRWGKLKPFYSMYNIGPYTFAPFKVAWKRTTRKFECVVISSIDDEVLGNRIVLANGKVMIVAFDNEDDAHFLCGFLNAASSRQLINSAITSEAHQRIIDVLPNLQPKKNGKTWKNIVSLSKRCHKLANERKAKKLVEAEEELDRTIRKQG